MPEDLFNSFMNVPDENGRFGDFGGRFVSETLMPLILELEAQYEHAKTDDSFWAEMNDLWTNYVGRPSPLYFAERLTDHLGGAKIYLKRDELNHTGAHKINNVLGQIILARRMGKTRIIAETGAGQHGVATATVCAKFGLKCVVYMGAHDVERQAPNVFRMRLLGAEVVPVTSGRGAMVRDFQSIIGKETKEQMMAAEGRLPDTLIAAIGGGSNAIGLFHPFLDDKDVNIIGVEAGGKGVNAKMEHCASLTGGRPGVLHGNRTYLLQDDDGQILEGFSISAGHRARAFMATRDWPRAIRGDHGRRSARSVSAQLFNRRHHPSVGTIPRFGACDENRA